MGFEWGGGGCEGVRMEVCSIYVCVTSRDSWL